MEGDLKLKIFQNNVIIINFGLTIHDINPKRKVKTWLFGSGGLSMLPLLLIISVRFSDEPGESKPTDNLLDCSGGGVFRRDIWGGGGGSGGGGGGGDRVGLGRVVWSDFLSVLLLFDSIINSDFLLF